MKQQFKTDTADALTLRCIQCNALATPGCSCGVSYDYISPGQLAERAIKAHPEKSDRAIAAELGIHKNTVSRSRGAGGPFGPPSAAENPEQRIGRDGKTYKQPKFVPAKRVDPPPPQPPPFLLAYTRFSCALGDVIRKLGQIERELMPDIMLHRARLKPDLIDADIEELLAIANKARGLSDKLSNLTPNKRGYLAVVE